MTCKNILIESGKSFIAHKCVDCIDGVCVESRFLNKDGEVTQAFKTTYIVFRSNEGLEVATVKNSGANNTRQVAIERYNGKFEIINRAEIIVEKENKHDALEAKLRGEAVDIQYRDFYLAALSAYNRAKFLFQSKVDEAIQKVPE